MTEPGGVATAPSLSLAERLRDLLAGPAPLTLAELTKKMRPKGKRAPSADAFAAELGLVLDDEGRSGRVFRHPSGADGVERFWGRDEKQAVREAVEAAAAEPKAMTALAKTAKGAVKGLAAAFAEAVIGDLIAAGALYEHPPATKAGGPRWATYAPPPPLERPKFRKKLDALLKSVEKLRSDANVSADDVFAALRSRLPGEAGDGHPPPPAPHRSTGPVTAAHSPALAELDELILKAVRTAGPGSVLSLADLRREMPAEYRGRVFDETVLRLDDEGRLSVYQDSDPAALSAEERAEYVADDLGHVFKTIARRV